jgi:hypothetical protein
MIRLGLALPALFVLLGARPGVAQAPASAAKPVPPGTKVLAETRGKQGVIRVEERDGLRSLTINGIVQGSKRVAGKAGGQPLAVLQADAAAALARAASPKGRRALVVGLGTGQTAAELLAGGWTIDAVDIEPAVVTYARQYFGYQGPAEVMDGLTALGRNRHYDLVLIDAATDKQLPAELVDDHGLELVRRALANVAAVVAFRMVGRPDTRQVAFIPHRRTGGSDDGDDFYFLFGSGVGDEEQNLYLLWSRQQFQVLAPPGLSLQLLRAGSHGEKTFDVQALREDAADGGRRVLLVGYLIRMKENGQLALDLPHYEMGAMRFRLVGAAAEGLAARAPRAEQIFLADDDVDGKNLLSLTLNELVGGGGVQRSEVRFSPVVAAVEGTLRFRAAVDPDRVAWPFRTRDQETGKRLEVPLPVDEPLLPDGGVLYDLDVERVVMTYDRESWRKLTQRQKPVVAAIVRALRAGDLPGAARELHAHLEALDGELGQLAGRFGYVREMERLASALADAPEVDASAKSRAAACDQLVDAGAWRISADAAAMDKAAWACAMRFYEKAMAAGRDRKSALTAATHLLRLYDMHYTFEETHGERYERKADALKRRFGKALADPDDPTGP